MFDSRKLIAYAALTAAAAAVAPAVAVGAHAKQPKIAARPRSVMVNATTMLKGSGFPANTTIELRDCGRTFWLAPQQPCTADEVAVTTDARGRFSTGFPVGLCPEGESGKKPTQRICYIGELVTGEDTGSLVGAAKVKVTYP